MKVTQVPSGAKEVEVEMVVLGVDGKPTGVVRRAYWHRNPFKRVWGQLKIWMQERTWLPF